MKRQKTEGSGGMPEPEVKKYQAVFTAPPEAVPAGNTDVSGNGRWKIWQYAGTRTDAPVLGNGFMTSTFAGPCEYPQFWVTTNDFWEMQSAANWEFFHDNAVAKRDPAVCTGSPKPVGRIVFDIPALADAAYHVVQDFYTATTTASFRKDDGSLLTLDAYVAAEEDLLVLRFLSTKDMALNFEFRFPDETGKGCSVGVDWEGSGEDCGIGTCSEKDGDCGKSSCRTESADGGPADEPLNGMYVGLVGGRPVQVKQYRDGVISGYREFSDHTDRPVRDGFAACFVPAEGEPDERNRISGEHSYTPETVQLSAGKEAFFVLALRSWHRVSRPYEYARSRARWITRKDLAEIRRRHLAHWKRFWAISEIRTEDPLIGQRYYLSHYMLASVSGDPDFPPDILGTATFDRMAWNGNYKINYNHQTPYLSLPVSGHFRESDPHDAPYLAMLDLTREMSRRLLGHEGAYYPLGLGPQGMVSEALLLHMKSQAVHGALNMLIRWYLTYDAAYAEKIYPFLISIADFWEKELVKREDGYHVVGDGMHERITRDIEQNGQPEDPVNTLGYLRVFFGMLPEISRQLDTDENRRETWQEISAHIAPYPVGTIGEISSNPTLWDEGDADLKRLIPEEDLHKKVFYDEGKGGRWSLHFPGNIMQIYPGGAIGLSSPAEELETARNTVKIHSEMEHANAMLKYGRRLRHPDHPSDRSDYTYESLIEAEKHLTPEQKAEEFLERDGAWNSTNLSCLFFPAAVRAGVDPDLIWEEATDRIRYLGLPNGYYRGNPHGIENLNIIPAMLQEMMLQSYEGVIRIFPAWPSGQPEAAFRGLYARGAFRVSAVLSGGKTVRAEILSLQGSRLRVSNPWYGREGGRDYPMRLIHSQTGREEIVTGAGAETDTFAGEKIILLPEEKLPEDAI